MVSSRHIWILCLTGGLMVTCSVPKNEKSAEDNVVEAVDADYNPPGKNFNTDGSDAIAILLADQVMTAMCGRKAWDSTRFLSWNFFGSRKLLWNKKTGDVRIDFLKQDMKILLNVRNMEGMVQKNGIKLTNMDSVSFYLKRGKDIWINDSYWLVMPFKLKDSGVTLRYVREDTTLTGRQSEVLSLTFQDVGNTPDNKYEVWIDQKTKLVIQWAYYKSYNDSVASFTLPWGNYQQKGSILLSDDRGERDLTEVEVLKEQPEGAFSSFAKPIL